MQVTASIQLPALLFFTSWLSAKYSSKLRLLRQERVGLPSLLYHQSPNTVDLESIIEKNRQILLEYTFSNWLGLLDYYGEFQGAYTMFMRKLFPVSIHVQLSSLSNLTDFSISPDCAECIHVVNVLVYISVRF